MKTGLPETWCKHRGGTYSRTEWIINVQWRKMRKNGKRQGNWSHLIGWAKRAVGGVQMGYCAGIISSHCRLDVDSSFESRTRFLQVLQMLNISVCLPET